MKFKLLKKKQEPTLEEIQKQEEALITREISIIKLHSEKKIPLLEEYLKKIKECKTVEETDLAVDWLDREIELLSEQE